MDLHTTGLGWSVIGCAITVHKALGPGLLESAYDGALAHELDLRGHAFKRQVPLPARYKNQDLGRAYRVDFLVEGELVLELKTVSRLLPVHRAQMLTYLRLLQVRQGFLSSRPSRYLFCTNCHPNRPLMHRLPDVTS
jgi:GxxExxY protein